MLLAQRKIFLTCFLKISLIGQKYREIPCLVNSLGTVRSFNFFQDYAMVFLHQGLYWQVFLFAKNSMHHVLCCFILNPDEFKSQSATSNDSFRLLNCFLRNWLPSKSRPPLTSPKLLYTQISGFVHSIRAPAAGNGWKLQHVFFSRIK